MSIEPKSVQEGGICPGCGRAPNECELLREQVEALARVVETLAASVRKLDSRTIGLVKFG